MSSKSGVVERVYCKYPLYADDFDEARDADAYERTVVATAEQKKRPTKKIKVVKRIKRRR